MRCEYGRASFSVPLFVAGDIVIEKLLALLLERHVHTPHYFILAFVLEILRSKSFAVNWSALRPFWKGLMAEPVCSKSVANLRLLDTFL
jgi:hypothetical protein